MILLAALFINFMACGNSEDLGKEGGNSIKIGKEKRPIIDFDGYKVGDKFKDKGYQGKAFVNEDDLYIVTITTNDYAPFRELFVIAVSENQKIRHIRKDYKYQHNIPGIYYEEIVTGYIQEIVNIFRLKYKLDFQRKSRESYVANKGGVQVFIHFKEGTIGNVISVDVFDIKLWEEMERKREQREIERVQKIKI
jgi:hypothetical protein